SYRYCGTHPSSCKFFPQFFKFVHESFIFGSFKSRNNIFQALDVISDFIHGFFMIVNSVVKHLQLTYHMESSQIETLDTMAEPIKSAFGVGELALESVGPYRSKFEWP